MNKLAKTLLGIIIALTSTITVAQDQEKEVSNVQKYTPSKLLSKGQWDLKFFNSFYSETTGTDENSKKFDKDRENYFTNTNEIYTGVSENSRLNIGLIFQIRSNTFNDAGRFSVLEFKDNPTDARSGLTVIAPSIRFQPFKNIGNFSITSSFYIPVFKDVNYGYLDQRSFAWENKFFYDNTFGGGKWQIFTELDLKFNFGEKSEDAAPDTNQGERFANNSISTPISGFLSYFPNSKSTIFVNLQQFILLGYDNGDFSQEGTLAGFGGKYQLTPALNIEASYGNIFRGTSQGTGDTLSIGLRMLF